MSKANELRDIADFANQRGEKYENEQARILYAEWVDGMRRNARRGMYDMKIVVYPKEVVDFVIVEKARGFLVENGFSIGEFREEDFPCSGDSAGEGKVERRIYFSVSWGTEE